MSLAHIAFSLEIIKIAAEKSKRKRSYPAAVWAGLPFAVGGALTDIPKGALEDVVEKSLRPSEIAKAKAIKVKPSAGAAITKGISRGGGRLAAGGLTAPIFLSGIKDIRDAKDSKQRNRGIAKVIGSGFVYGAGKGAIETAGVGAVRQMRRKGVNAPKPLGVGQVQKALKSKGIKWKKGTRPRFVRTLAKEMKGVAGARGILGVGAAAITAAGVAKSLKAPKAKEKKQTAVNRYAVPALYGGMAGAGKGAFEEVWTKGLKAFKTNKGTVTGKSLRKGLRGVGAKSSGRAAAGVLGAVALTELARAALKPKKGKVKTADSKLKSYAIDFVGGLDPMGAITSRAAAEAQRKRESEKSHITRKALAASGGTLGGSIVVPSLISGITGAVQGAAKGPKGIGKGFVEGAKKPLSNLYAAIRSKRVLSKVKKGVPLSGGDAKALRRTTSQITLGDVAKSTNGMKRGDIGRMVKVIEKAQSGAKIKSEGAKELADKVSPEISKGLRQGLTAMAMGGAVGGGGAYVQYAKGRSAEKGFQKRIRSAKRMQKSASQAYPLYMGPRPGELYGDVSTWAKSAPLPDVQRQYAAIMARGQPEATPTRRAVTYAMHDAIAARGGKPSSLAMRNRVHRPELVRNPTMLETGLIAGIIASPMAAFHIAFSEMKPTDKDKILNDSLDRMISVRGIERMNAGSTFWGMPTTKKPAEAYFMEMSNNPKLVQQLRDEGIEGARIADKLEKGKTKFISTRTQEIPEIVAHELGHATAGRLRKILQSSVAGHAYTAGRAASIIIPLLAFEGASDKSFATPEELEARARLISGGGKLALAAQTPVLAEEALASGKALTYMLRAGASPERTLASLKRLAPAFATYALPAMAPFIAAKYLRSKAKKGRRRAGQ